MMNKALKIITWPKVSYILITIIMLLTLLITTHWGNRLLIKAIEKKIPALHMELASGSVLFSPQFSIITYENANVSVDINDAALDWKLSCLWQSNVCVDSLAVNHLSVILAAPTTNTKDESNHKIDSKGNLDLGVDIVIKSLIANTIDVKYNYYHVALTQLDTSLELITNNLVVNQLQLASIVINNSDILSKKIVAPSGITDDPFNINQRIIGLQQTISQLSPPKLPINVTLKNSLMSHFSYQSHDNTIDVKNISAAFTQHQQHINALTLNAAYLENTVKLTGDLSLEPNLEHQLNLALKTNHQLIGHSTIALNSNGNLAKLTLNGDSSGDFEATLTGDLSLTQPNVPLNLSASWQPMELTLNSLNIEAGQLSLTGDLARYTLQLETGIEHQNVPTITGNINAHGSVNQLVIDEANFSLLDGDVSLNGIFSWVNGLSLTSKLTMVKLQPHAFWPDYQGELSGNVQASASIKGKHWQTNLTNIDIEGLWLDRALNVSGNITGSVATDTKNSTWGQWQVDNLVLTHHQNQLAINGTVAEESRLTAQISVNDMAATLPMFLSDKPGKINGTLSLIGPLEKLQLATLLTAQNIHYKPQNLSFEHAIITANAILSQALPFDINVVAKQFTFPKTPSSNTLSMKVPSINEIPSKYVSQKSILTKELAKKSPNEFVLSFSGNKANHLLNATLTSSALNAKAKISGQFTPSQWQGTIDNANISVNQQHLTLASPLTILANIVEKSLSLSPHCWLSTVSGQSLHGSLCLTSPFTIDTQLVRSNEAVIKLDKFSMAQLQPYLPPEHVVSGNVDGHLSFQLFSAEKLSLSSKIQWLNGLIKSDFGDSMVSHKITELTISAAIDRHLANFIAHLSSPTLGTIDVSMVSSIFDKQPFVSGHIKSHGLELAPYRPFFKYVSILDGQLSISAGFSGDLNQQQIFGQLTSNNIAIASDKLPSRIKNLNTQLTLNGASATLDSSFDLASGHGALKGSFDWTEKLLATLDLTGDALSLSPNKGIDVVFSPNLNLTLTPELAKIRGSINVDSAHIKIKSLPQSSVGLSNDVVIKQQANTKRAIALDINVNALLGEQLTIDAFGLKSTVKGALNIVQNNIQPLSTYGELALKDAKYKAFGQNLIIEQGQIIFTGSAANPIINIKAIRDPKETNDNVIAGVYVNGAVDKPVLTVFTVPDLDQQEAISYLIHGHKSGGGESFGEKMAISMIVNSGLGGASKMIGNIGSAVGIDNFNVTTSGSGDSTRVEFSGSIGPKLQLRYGVGVFEALPEVGLRYQVNQRLFVEFINNTNQALELLYRFSFD